MNTQVISLLERVRQLLGFYLQIQLHLVLTELVEVMQGQSAEKFKQAFSQEIIDPTRELTRQCDEILSQLGKQVQHE